DRQGVPVERVAGIRYAPSPTDVRRNRRRHRIVGALPVLIALSLYTGVADAQEIRTASESADYARHTTYAEMMDYLQALKTSSLDMRLGIYGETREGRELPYV